MENWKDSGSAMYSFLLSLLNIYLLNIYFMSSTCQALFQILETQLKTKQTNPCLYDTYTNLFIIKQQISKIHSMLDGDKCYEGT